MNQKELQYTAKSPYIFNKVTVNEKATHIFSDIYAPSRHMHRSILQTHTALHQHDYFEVIFIISGEIIQIIENQTFHYTSGQCCILNRNICHSEVYYNKAELLFMMLTEEFLTPLVDDTFIYSTTNIYHNAFDSISLLINQNKHCKYYNVKKYISFSPVYETSPFDFQAETNTIVEQIINATYHQKAGCGFIVAGLISRFFSILEDSSKFTKNVISLTRECEEKLLTLITDLLEKNKGNISRRNLEQQLHYNADYINRVVKKSTGLTLTEYGHLFGLQEAAHLLQTTDDTISDIVANLGFSNRTYFNKIFRCKYGMTPIEYRNSSRN